ncbi:MAG: DUF4112 domain-containing protein [Caldilinea sp. CFX5]|nr:DUF4112 domain-containing protein [Caldilinea sp. CFX5]
MTTKLTQSDENDATENGTPSSRQERAQIILKQVDDLAWLLDNSIYIPLINYRIGLDAVIGLIPGLGDVAGLILSSFIVLQALRLRAPRAVLMRMIVNIVMEALIGLIPVLGDLFDATFKANVRNVRLLRQAMAQPGVNPALDRADKGVIVTVLGLLVGVIVLIGSAGAAVAWGIVALFS